ncbi:hypothetical protein BDV12DRAFT_201296 [Aspergillus spectabilis]
MYIPPLLLPLTLLSSLTLSLARTLTIPDGPGQIHVYQSPNWEAPTGCLHPSGHWTLNTTDCATYTKFWGDRSLYSNFDFTYRSPQRHLTVTNSNTDAVLGVEPGDVMERWERAGRVRSKNPLEEVPVDFLRVLVFYRSNAVRSRYLGPIWLADNIPEGDKAVVLSTRRAGGAWTTKAKVGLKFVLDDFDDERWDL